MNYRHIYHAGNFADVLKHAALVAILLHLRKKETPFVVIDTHAGSGLYDLSGAQAARTGEAEEGISKLLQAEALPGVLEAYATLVKGFGARYPGSPLIAARLLRARDRLIAVEKHEEEFAALASVLAPERRVRAVLGDGYRELERLLPPTERRGLVLLDPPYEESDEFPRAASALIAAHRRFATGIFLLWYPIKERGAVEAAIGEILNAGIPKLLRVELDIGEAPAEEGRAKLGASGLLAVNPPFGFAAEMEMTGAYLARLLGRHSGAHARVELLAGER